MMTEVINELRYEDILAPITPELPVPLTSPGCCAVASASTEARARIENFMVVVY